MASKPRFMFNRSVSFKDTSDGWKAVIFVLSLYLFSQGQGTIHIVCEKSNTDTVTASIPLTCSSDQMIHVISELYGRRTSEENCTIVRADLNTRVSDSSTNGLIVICNGYKQCTEQAACGTNCNGSGNAYEITYECVEDSKSVCNVFNQNVRLPSLYLHSPMFPASQDEEPSCECSVSGQSLDVMMIQHRGSQGVLQINTTGAENKTWESNFNTFNTKISSDARHVVVLTYTNRAFWLRVSGNITHISCSNSLTPPKTTATTEATETTQTIEATETPETIETINTTEATEATETTETTETIETINTTEAIEATEATGVKETIGSAEATEAIKGTVTKETPEVTTIMTEAIEITTKTGDGSSSQTSSAATRSDIIVPAAVSGGVFLLIALIIFTVFVCRKKKVSTRTMKNDCDIQLTSHHDDARGNEQMYDNKVFKENQESVDMTDYIVDNELCHSNKSRSIVNKGYRYDDQEFERVANDVYGTDQAVSKPDIDPQTCPTVNAKYPVDNASEEPADDAVPYDIEDVEEEDGKNTPMADVNHSSESNIANVALTPEMNDNVDEDVMVTNDLYHSYRSQENMPIPQDMEVQEEIVMENSDLYQKNRNPEIMPIAQQTEDQEEIVMEDNDLYHSFKNPDNIYKKEEMEKYYLDGTRNTAVMCDTESYHNANNGDTVD